MDFGGIEFGIFLISLRCRAARDRNVARKLNQIDPWAERK